MKPSRVANLRLSVERYLATRIEPRLGRNAWFTWRIENQMRKIREFESELEERRAAEGWLTNYESSEFSQNGEDGILREIFNRLDMDRGTFVETGCSDGSENCTRSLVEAGWSGLWIEGDPERADQARAAIGDRPVQVVNAFVTKDNIVSLLTDNDIGTDLDLLVIDIDGNDWWVIRELLKRFRPRVVALEYNAAMGARRWVMPYNAEHNWQYDRWHGASLRAFTDLLAVHDLTLVGTDSLGVNAFYVRSEDAGAFCAPGDASTHYSPPRYRLPFGHRWQYDATEIDPLDEAAVTGVDITVSRYHESDGGKSLDLIVDIRNRSQYELRSSGTHPVHLAAWWSTDGSRPETEPERFLLLWPIPAQHKRPTFVRIERPDDDSMLFFDLVQEGHTWFSEARHNDWLARFDPASS